MHNHSSPLLCALQVFCTRKAEFSANASVLQSNALRDSVHRSLSSVRPCLLRTSVTAWVAKHPLPNHHINDGSWQKRGGGGSKMQRLKGAPRTHQWKIENLPWPLGLWTTSDFPLSPGMINFRERNMGFGSRFKTEMTNSSSSAEDAFLCLSR